jgi:two-component system phosphate regulon sensor histidine kinase PhoR
MTHELKTPLATISMTADTLALASVSQSPEKVSEYSGMIKNEVKKLSLHVDKILHAALLEKNGDRQQHELICINRLIEDEVKTYEPLVHQRNGTISAGVPAQTITLHANKDLLSGAVSNLLDNALKYSHEHPIITVAVRPVNDKIILSVKDEGIGISKSDQALIFEKFYRAPTGNRHDVKGFGLGLSFVKDVIENLKGKIWVESELGKGSTFFIEIPVN